jgi:uncharacterized cupredoxin-like copper-binding protein
MRKILLLLGLILGTVFLAACGGGAQSSANTVKDVTIVATDIAYDVNRIEVVAGQPLKVTLQNDGALVHDFSIMGIPVRGEVMADELPESEEHDMSNMGAVEPQVHVAAPVGASASVQFTPSQAGEYEYFCTVAGHKEAGMVGTLVVTNP